MFRIRTEYTVVTEKNSMDRNAKKKFVENKTETVTWNKMGHDYFVCEYVKKIGN